MKMKGFWNDPGGLTIDEFTALLVLPLFLYVGVKMALAGDKITSVQVDFFTVLTYPIIAVVARQVVEKFGFPATGRNKQSPVSQMTYNPTEGGVYSENNGDQPYI